MECSPRDIVFDHLFFLEINAADAEETATFWLFVPHESRTADATFPTVHLTAWICTMTEWRWLLHRYHQCHDGMNLNPLHFCSFFFFFSSRERNSTVQQEHIRSLPGQTSTSFFCVVWFVLNTGRNGIWERKTKQNSKCHPIVAHGWIIHH